LAEIAGCRGKPGKRLEATASLPEISRCRIRRRPHWPCFHPHFVGKKTADPEAKRRVIRLVLGGLATGDIER
jgi:hypothetical protein